LHTFFCRPTKESMKKHKVFDNPTGDDVYYEYGAPGAAYNAAGRVTKETVGTLIDQYCYGALGEVVKKTRTIDGKQYSITWKWDNFGRLRTIVYSNNVIIYYAYDTGGQVKQVFGYYNGMRMDYVNNVYYDEFGSRTTIAYANGVTGQYSYDVLMHRLVQLKTFMGDSTYQNITYSYDKVGNIVTRSENGIVMSDNTVKNITHHYGYDSLYRLTQAEGFIKENGTTVNSYTSTLQYSSIGTIVQKLQTVKIAGENDPSLTYSYNYSYAPNKPHAVAGINDNLTYRYDANGNMTAVYDTAKQFNRILSWDDDNRLTKTVDTTSGASVTTQYNYDAKGMRIIKDGPYGKSIYIDTGYVESGAPQTVIASNHIFVGNTRVASVVKHRDEASPATYYYASDHLGSSSVLTNNAGSYHERIEYLPYGETWVEDKATSDGYSTPYKFTGKELDAETGLYYFGARYYDARVSRWISADPALADGKYFPKPNDYDTEHDFCWYLQQDGSKKLAGLGGVFNAVNMDVYHYAGDNPVKLVDPDGNQSLNPLDLGLTDPISFVIDILRYKYETPFNEAKNKITSTSIGFATGFVKGFFGPDFSKLIEKCGKNMNGFYAEEFQAAIDSGELTGMVAGLLNFTAGAYKSGQTMEAGYELGTGIVNKIISDPKTRKEFLLGYAKGFVPSAKPPKFNSIVEAAGWLIGNKSYQKYWEEQNK